MSMCRSASNTLMPTNNMKTSKTFHLTSLKRNSRAEFSLLNTSNDFGVVQYRACCMHEKTSIKFHPEKPIGHNLS